jgi:arylsulfatase A-like enzyme
MSAPTPPRVHLELMWAYASAVSFADSQLGRVLDAVNDLKLWGNLTIVLTSDHGMHNGEKGMWCVNRSC